MKGHPGKKNFFSTACVAVVLFVASLLTFPWLFAMNRNDSSVLRGNVDPAVIAEITSQIVAKLNLKKVRRNSYIK